MGSRVKEVDCTTHEKAKSKLEWVVECKKLMVLPTEKLI